MSNKFKGKRNRTLKKSLESDEDPPLKKPQLDRNVADSDDEEDNQSHIQLKRKHNPPLKKSQPDSNVSDSDDEDDNQSNTKGNCSDSNDDPPVEEEELPEEDESSEDELDEESSESDAELPANPEPYTKHYGFTLPEGFNSENLEYESKQLSLPAVGQMKHIVANVFPTERPKTVLRELTDFNIKINLLTALQNSSKGLSPFQLGFYSLINDYFDVAYTQRTHRKGKALREVYSLHILNHILKSRAKIIHHNYKLSKNPDAEYRDQGFTRPAALVLVPFRNDCYKIVRHLTSLLPEAEVMNKKRFDREYGPTEKPHRVKKKPPDYDHIFEGNINEDFKIGLRIKNKSITLYCEFYVADLIIASPLALRQIEGEKEKGRDFDFLSSIELLIIDRADVLYMQNVYHLMHIMKHFNLLPKDSHGCNFFRVRIPTLDGMSKFYRQTIMISSVEHVWLRDCLLNNFCHNYKGSLQLVVKPKSLEIDRIFDTVRVVFRWFDFTDPNKEFEDRFDFFVNQVLPNFRAEEMAQTLLFIPCYYDFIRIRNYFREKEISAVMLCEYSKPAKVAQGRNNFFRGNRHFMLYTERLHFYHRYHIKGVQHLLFYQPPTYPVFFREMAFSYLDSHPRRAGEEKTCTIVASKMDALQIKYIIGADETNKMLSSDKKIFVQYTKGL